jgi:hypothetical protein
MGQAQEQVEILIIRKEILRLTHNDSRFRELFNIPGMTYREDVTLSKAKGLFSAFVIKF